MGPTVQHVLTSDADATQSVIAASSNVSRHVDGHLNVGNHEDSDENDRQVNSSLELALHDDDAATVKEISEDGHSYDGTIVRGGLRRDSE